MRILNIWGISVFILFYTLKNWHIEFFCYYNFILHFPLSFLGRPSHVLFYIISVVFLTKISATSSAFMVSSLFIELARYMILFLIILYLLKASINFSPKYDL